MPPLPPRLAFLYPPLPLFYPRTTAVIARRYRHGTAVEPTPIQADTTAVKGETQAAAAGAAKDATTGAGEGVNIPPSLPPQQQVLSLAPGEWVHHFDTFTVAKSLERSGFKSGQSVAIMKGVRGLLAANLEFAKENLVSRSDVENESYLFHAACSELRIEIQNTRKTQIDNLRANGTAIQQEYDLLNQRFLEDIMSLKDELNGLFNDRKIVTRAEQRAMENRIQELNYKITVLINSDLRNEIGRLRWTTTRRWLVAIAALSISVTLILLRKNSRESKKGKGDTRGKYDTHDFGDKLSLN